MKCYNMAKNKIYFSTHKIENHTYLLIKAKPINNHLPLIKYSKINNISEINYMNRKHLCTNKILKFLFPIDVYHNIFEMIQM